MSHQIFVYTASEYIRVCHNWSGQKCKDVGMKKAKEEKDLEEARKNAPELDPDDEDNEEER